MIFRVSGVRKLLALTPVLHEWKRRKMGEVLVETPTKRILDGNSDVDGVGLFFGRDDQQVVDIDAIPWQLKSKPVTESYSGAVFGDTSLRSWQMVMSVTDEEREQAGRLMPSGKIAFLAPGMAENRESIVHELTDKGYNVLSAGSDVGWGVFLAMVELSDLYVGEQGEASVVAMVTNTPGVVVHHWENPAYFAPFRKMPTFEAVCPTVEVCNEPGPCLAKNGVFEFGRTYGVRCPKEPQFQCKNWDCTKAVMEAVERVAIA